MTGLDPKLEKIAKRATTDYYFFCKQILGYEKMRPQPHQEICDFLEAAITGDKEKRGKRKKLLLEPRGSFKSSVATVGGSLFALQKNPNLRILIAGATQKNAKKFVKEVKTHIEQNQKFQAVFGNWVNEENTWRDDEFIINRRTIVKKEASVMAASLEKQSTTGQHYDLIFLDDPVDLNNINTPEQIEKTINFYKMLLSVLEPDGAIIVIGTRYSALDLYGWLSDDDSPEKDQIDILIREAIDDDGNLLFPEVLTKEFLEEQRKTQGEFMFACQYLNRPVSSGTCYFSPETIKFYDTPPKGLIYFLTLDPAISTKARSDYSAFIVNGVDHLHNWYILEAIAKKLTPSEVVKQVFDLYEKYKIQFMLFGMEKHTLEQVLKLAITEEQNKRGIAFPIKELPTDTRVSKENRIRALQPRFQNGQIYIHKSQTALYHQILYYPLGTKHDDLLDALKSQLAVTFPSPFVSEINVQDYPNLTPIEQKIWKDAMKLGTRKVRQKGYRL
jgi:predicted phage terminase large subunit-like protein